MKKHRGPNKLHKWRDTAPERFWAHVLKNGPVPSHRPNLGGCWVWTGTILHGYGVFPYVQLCGTRRAHRIAWYLSRGPIPTGVFVCHKCDNTKCVRPSHLFLGDAKSNMADKVRKGRWRGVGLAEAHPMHKLTRRDVKTIHRLSSQGMSSRQIADRFDNRVGSRHIRDIVSGRYRTRG